MFEMRLIALGKGSKSILSIDWLTIEREREDESIKTLHDLYPIQISAKR